MFDLLDQNNNDSGDNQNEDFSTPFNQTEFDSFLFGFDDCSTPSQERVEVDEKDLNDSPFDVTPEEEEENAEEEKDDDHVPTDENE